MTDKNEELFENDNKPKWKKIDNELPFATKPVYVNPTESVAKLPWSQPESNDQSLIVEKTANIKASSSSLIAGDISENVNIPDDDYTEEAVNDSTEHPEEKHIISDGMTIILNQPSQLEENSQITVGDVPTQESESETSVNSSENSANTQEATSQNFANTQDDQKKKMQDSITETAASLPKIFNDNALPEQPQEFEAPIEISETETTMIRRRSLMGETRRKQDDGYDENHVRLAWQPLKQEEPKTEEEELETILEGATVYPTLPSRAVAHWWSIFLGLLFLPISWYLVNDGVERISDQTYSTMNFSTAGIEVVCASVLFAIFLIVTQFSSVGTFIMGVFTVLISIPFLFFPKISFTFIDPILNRSEKIGGIIHSILLYFTDNMADGILFFFGIILIFIGFVAHTSRRLGRREQQIRNDLGLVGVDDRIAKKAKKMALKAEKAEAKAKAKMNKNNPTTK